MTKKNIITSALALALVLSVSAIPAFAASTGNLTMSNNVVDIDPNQQYEVIDIDGTEDNILSDEEMNALLNATNITASADCEAVVALLDQVNEDSNGSDAIQSLTVTDGIEIDENADYEVINIDCTNDDLLSEAEVNAAMKKLFAELGIDDSYSIPEAKPIQGK